MNTVVPSTRVNGVLAPGQDGVRKMPVDVVHLCGQLQVVGERGEPLAAAVQSGRLFCQARGREVHGGQMWLDGLWRHGHGVVRGHGELDPAGEGVFGFVLEVRVRTLTAKNTVEINRTFKKKRGLSSQIKETCRSEEVLSMWEAWIGGTEWIMGAPVL